MITPKNYLHFLLFFVICCYSTSCVSTKKNTYFNDAKNIELTPSTDDTVLSVIKKNDILGITIKSLNAEASSVFNTSNNQVTSTVTSAGVNQTGSGYLVNSDGYIQLPILGNIKVEGYTTKEVRELITRILLEKKLLIDPIVSIQHLNYEITVLGEVGKPTVVHVPSEKISLLKALGLAGDITVFGKKDNVILIREIDGKRVVRRIDLNSPDFLTSPYYYLQPNDVVYVEANKNKVTSASTFRQILPSILAALSVLLLTLDNIIQ